jgi:SAM-dependent methyltransferase
MLLPSRRPTIARWRRLSSTKYSILRALEYERIEGMKLAGLILDFGGGAKTSYNQLFSVDGTLESVNIDPGIEPTYLADLNKTLPIPSGRYDAVISLNTLEHVLSDRVAVDEMYRVLKPGGEAHIIVPFIYRVHGSPYDYHRHTATAWIEILTEAGFAHDTIRIEPFVFGGALTTSFSLVEFLLPVPFHILARHLVLFLPIVKRSSGNPDFPLGYYIQVKKQPDPKP